MQAETGKKELMKQHVWDIVVLPGHLKLSESNRVVRLREAQSTGSAIFTAIQDPII